MYELKERKGGRIERRHNGKMEGRKDTLKEERQKEGKMEGRKDGRKERWREGKIEGRKDRGK